MEMAVLGKYFSEIETEPFNNCTDTDVSKCVLFEGRKVQRFVCMFYVIVSECVCVLFFVCVCASNGNGEYGGNMIT